MRLSSKMAGQGLLTSMVINENNNQAGHRKFQLHFKSAMLLVTAVLFSDIRDEFAPDEHCTLCKMVYTAGLSLWKYPFRWLLIVINCEDVLDCSGSVLGCGVQAQWCSTWHVIGNRLFAGPEIAVRDSLTIGVMPGSSESPLDVASVWGSPPDCLDWLPERPSAALRGFEVVFLESEACGCALCSDDAFTDSLLPSAFSLREAPLPPTGSAENAYDNFEIQKVVSQSSWMWADKLWNFIVRQWGLVCKNEFHQKL